MRRKFQIDDKVLILLPTKANKLLLQWKGPYKVIDVFGQDNYRVSVGGKIKSYHANLLKLYEPRNIVSIAVLDPLPEEHEFEEDKIYTVSPGKETYKDVNINPQLSKVQKREVRELLYEFRDVLTDKPGLTDLIKHDIVTVTDQVVNKKPYPLPYAMLETVKEEVRNMLDTGVIEPSNSPYASPYLLVKKKDNTNRFVIDFRELDRITVFGTEPLPNIEQIYCGLAQKKIFSSFDLTKGYWQIPLTEGAKDKTSFQTPLGSMRFKVLPFGLQCASQTFTRLMRRLLHQLDNVDNFIDDVIAADDDWQQHLITIRRFFERLARHNLTARPTKCFIGFSKIQCLGHLVGENSLSPLDDKVKAICNAETPKTKRQVRSFLGLIGFYRRYVKDFAKLAAPLCALTKKHSPNKIRWTTELEGAFRSLIKCLVEKPILKLPEVHKPFILQTDASNEGIGAVLLQTENEVKKPIAFISKQLKDAERNYSTIEKECLSIIWAIEKFQRYLYGKEFYLETDHQPLQYLQRSKTLNPRLMRWAMRIQPYRFCIKAIRGLGERWG